MERGPNHQSGSRGVPESQAEPQGSRAGDQACASKSSAGLETETSASKTLLEKAGAALDLGLGRAAPSLSAHIPGTSDRPQQRWIRGAIGTPTVSSPH